LLELKKYTSKNSPYQLYIKILSDVECTDNFEQAQRETIFIKDICKRVLKSSTILYVLRDKEKTLGFIALSVNSIDSLPSLQVDYLFVSNPYRGVILEELKNTKTSIYLIEFAIEIAKEIQEKVGLRSLVLLPDSQRLEYIYKKIGFQKFPKKDWMFFKL
jgi:hypothetical protein